MLKPDLNEPFITIGGHVGGSKSKSIGLFSVLLIDCKISQNLISQFHVEGMLYGFMAIEEKCQLPLETIHCKTVE